MRIATVAGCLLGVSILLAACSSSGGATTAPASVAPVSQAPAGDASASASAPAAGATTVAVGDTSLGKIIVDGKGLSLYMFTPDSGGTSTCYDKCASAWPPLMSDGGAPTVGEGLDAGDFGTTDRTDGTKQVTFHGMPLYYFAGDAGAGDTKGQGLNDKWYVVGPDGTPIK